MNKNLIVKCDWEYYEVMIYQSEKESESLSDYKGHLIVLTECDWSPIIKQRRYHQLAACMSSVFCIGQQNVSLLR